MTSEASDTIVTVVVTSDKDSPSTAATAKTSLCEDKMKEPEMLRKEEAKENLWSRPEWTWTCAVFSIIIFGENLDLDLTKRMKNVTFAYKLYVYICTVWSYCM